MDLDGSAVFVGSGVSVVGCGAVVSVVGATAVVGVGDEGVLVVVVLVEVPVLVWALTTTPSATVLDVALSVVVVVVVVFDSDGWAVADGSADFVWVVPVVAVDVEFVPVDPVTEDVFDVLTFEPEEVVSSARAMP